MERNKRTSIRETIPISKVVDLGGQTLVQSFNVGRDYGEPPIGLSRRGVDNVNGTLLPRQSATQKSGGLASSSSSLTNRSASVKISEFEMCFEKLCLSFNDLMKRLFVISRGAGGMSYTAVEEVDRLMLQTRDAFEEEKDLLDRGSVEKALSFSSFISSRIKLILTKMEPIERMQFITAMLGEGLYNKELHELETLVDLAIMQDESTLETIRDGLSSKHRKQLDKILLPGGDNQKQELLALLKSHWIPFSVIMANIKSAIFDYALCYELDLSSIELRKAKAYYLILNSRQTLTICEQFQRLRPDEQILGWYKNRIECLKTHLFFLLVTEAKDRSYLLEDNSDQNSSSKDLAINRSSTVRLNQSAYNILYSLEKEGNSIYRDIRAAAAKVQSAKSSVLVDFSMLSSESLRKVQNELQRAEIVHGDDSIGSEKGQKRGNEADSILLAAWREFQKEMERMKWEFMLSGLNPYNAVLEITKMIHSKMVDIVSELIRLNMVHSYKPEGEEDLFLVCSLIKETLALLSETRSHAVISQFSYSTLVALSISPYLFKPDNRIIQNSDLERIDDQLRSQIKKLEDELISDTDRLTNVAFSLVNIIEALSEKIGYHALFIVQQLKAEGAANWERKVFNQKLSELLIGEPRGNTLREARDNLFMLFENGKELINAQQRISACLREAKATIQIAEQPEDHDVAIDPWSSDAPLHAVDAIEVQKIMLDQWLSTENALFDSRDQALLKKVLWFMNLFRQLGENNLFPIEMEEMEALG